MGDSQQEGRAGQPVPPPRFLDEDIWQPTALGQIGPHGWLGWLSDHRGGGALRTLYCPFHADLLKPPAVPAQVARRLAIVHGRANLAADPVVATAFPPVLRPSPDFPDDTWIGVIGRSPVSGATEMFGIATGYPEDARLAFFRYAWRMGAGSPLAAVVASLPENLAAETWALLLLVHDSAVRGYVGAVAQVEPGGFAERILRNFFVTAEELAARRAGGDQEIGPTVGQQLTAQLGRPPAELAPLVFAAMVERARSLPPRSDASTVVFEIADAGTYAVTLGPGTAATWSEGGVSNPAVVVRMPLEVGMEMLRGDLDPVMAFAYGRLTVEGDLVLADTIALLLQPSAT